MYFLSNDLIIFFLTPVNTCPVVEKPKITHDTTICEKLKSIVNTSVLRKKKYVIWAVAMTIALLG